MAIASREKLVFVMVGPRHAGKTVFLTALANCASITSGDPATIKLLKLHWSALRQGKNPQATAGTYTDLEFVYRGEAGAALFDVEFIIPDYDGHFAEIMSDYDSGSKGLDELRASFEIADGFIIFMPYDRDDIKTMEAARFEIGHFIRIVRLFRAGNEKIDVPLAVIVNKWDKSPDFKGKNEDEAAAKFAESREAYRSLLRTLENFFANVFIIPVSAYGHTVEGDAPAPGELSPYRVDEPIKRLLTANYANFLAKFEKYKDEQNWPLVLETLDLYRKLWSRSNDAAEMEGFFSLALDNYAKELTPRLEAASSDDEWNAVFKEAKGESIVEKLKPTQRKALAATRIKSLNAAFIALRSRLEKAKNLEEFKNILLDAPESESAPFFTAEQKSEIEAFREKLAKAARRKKIFFWTKIACAAIFLFAAGALVFWRAEIESRYLEATDEQGSSMDQYRKLRGFLEYGVNSPATSRLFSSRFEDAKTRMERLRGTISETREKELAEIALVGDPRDRQNRAEEFFARLKDGEIAASEALLSRTRALRDQAKRVCDLIDGVETASSIDELEALFPRAAALPKGREKAELETRLKDREETLREKERIAAREAEDARRAEIARNLREEAARLRENGSYREALAFVVSRGTENPDVTIVEQALPEIYARNLLELAEEENPQELAYLLERSETLNKLDEAILNKLALSLKKRVSALEESLIDELEPPVGSLTQLEDAEEKLNEFDEITERIKRSPLARFWEPQPSAKLETLKKRLLEYRRILNHGIRASSFSVLAKEPNALNLRGRKWTSAFRKNDNLRIRFPDGSIADSADQGFSTEEKDGIFVLRFGSLDLEKSTGLFEMTAENGGEKLSCSWMTRIGVNELFALRNRGILKIPAGGTCSGLTLEFIK